MMRLAIIIDTLLVGGAQKLVVSFIEAQATQEIETTVISLSTASSPIIVEVLRATGVRVITYPSRSLFDLSRLINLIRFFKNEKFDLIHTHLTYSNILGCLSGYFSKTPVIVSLHSVASDKRRFSSQLSRIEELFVRNIALRIVAVGYAVAAANKKRFTGRRIEIIPNGTPTFNLVSSEFRQEIRNEFSMHGSTIILISVGRFAVPKGYDDMVDAFRILHERNPHTMLILVGKGSLIDHINNKISDLHLDDSVICLGERSDVPNLLVASDIYVSSSHREGLPVAILEAMMAGLPIISTAVGDIPHIVTEDVGFLVPPHNPERLADTIFELINSPDKIRAMGKAARARAIKEYSIDVWVTRMISLYKTTIMATV